jgi:aspartyl protease family protein
MASDPDSIARAIYLLILLVFIGGGAFLLGGRGFGRRLRDLSIWMLIFAMVVIAYGFRDVLRDQLLPAAMVQTSPDTVEIRRGSDGHFHATLEVDGTPVRFMVDTGASDIVLSRRDAERIGIDPATLSYRGRATTANGTVATARIRLGEVRLGNFSDTAVPASVSEGNMDLSLLGMAYLDRFANIEIAGDRMRLSR